MLTCLEATSDVLRIDEFRIGDTGLLPQFLDLCSIYEAGSVFFTAPYYDEEFIDDLSTHLLMASIDFEVIVKDENAARWMKRALLQRGGKSVQMYVSKHMHAKVYIFESRRRDLAMVIGSHNPTKAGISRNLEVGVFIGARPNKADWRSIVDLRTYLKKRSRTYSSSTKISEGA